METVSPMISEITKKISHYEIINNLIPGFVLFVILTQIGFQQLFIEEVWVKVVVCYILGLINSRFSSLVVEGLSRKLKFIEWRDYAKYNETKAKRPFVATLQENANMYRSFASLFLLSLFAAFYKLICGNCSWMQSNGYWIVLILLFLLYIFSYRKQVNDYVVKNIDEVVEEKKE